MSREFLNDLVASPNIPFRGVAVDSDGYCVSVSAENSPNVRDGLGLVGYHVLRKRRCVDVLGAQEMRVTS